MQKTFEEIVKEIVLALGNYDGIDLAELAKDILNKDVKYIGDGYFTEQ